MVVLVVGNSLLVEVFCLKLPESPTCHWSDITHIVDVDVEYEVSPTFSLVGDEGIPVAAKSHHSAIVASWNILGIKGATQHHFPTPVAWIARGGHNIGDTRQIEHQEYHNRKDAAIQYDCKSTLHYACYSEFGCKVSNYPIVQQAFSVNITCTTAK